MATGIDILPLRLAVLRQPGLWNQHRFRTASQDSPHREVDDILVRCQPLTKEWPNHRETLWYPAYEALPQVRTHVFSLMARVEGERLGRVMITRLAPGKQIYAHSDIGTDGLHYDTEPYWSRFHVLLQCPTEALFQAGKEIVWMPEGSCWWFDNTTLHRVWNDGQEDRLTLIIDIHCAEAKTV